MDDNDIASQMRSAFDRVEPVTVDDLRPPAPDRRRAVVLVAVIVLAALLATVAGRSLLQDRSTSAPGELARALPPITALPPPARSATTTVIGEEGTPGPTDELNRALFVAEQETGPTGALVSATVENDAIRIVLKPDYDSDANRAAAIRQLAAIAGVADSLYRAD